MGHPTLALSLYVALTRVLVPLASEGFSCCILTLHSYNLRAVQDFLKKYEKNPFVLIVPS
jgi:hypothetical protein